MKRLCRKRSRMTRNLDRCPLSAQSCRQTPAPPWPAPRPQLTKLFILSSSNSPDSLDSRPVIQMESPHPTITPCDRLVSCQRAGTANPANLANEEALPPAVEDDSGPRLMPSVRSELYENACATVACTLLAAPQSLHTPLFRFA